MRSLNLTSHLWLLTLAVWAVPLYAIVIRHDRADSAYQATESDFPQVFYLHTRSDNKVCMASLISEHWALTAAHCTEQTPLGASLQQQSSFAVHIAGKPNHVSAMVIHPHYLSGEFLQGTDLALLYLDTGVQHVKPFQLNALAQEDAQVMDLMGWGYSGIGTIGRQGNDGRFRRAQNQVEEAAQWLQFRFDDPRQPNSTALDLEGVPGLGDSGGPALWLRNGNWMLTGIAIGELEPPDPLQAQGRYGAIEIYERVSRHLDWIVRVMAAGFPEPVHE